MTEVAAGLSVLRASLRRRSQNPYEIVRIAILEELGVGSSRVVDGHVNVNLTLEAQGREVVAIGTLQAAWVGECRRCLSSMSGDLDLAVREVFAEDKNGGANRGSRDSSQEVDRYLLGAESWDLEPMVRDAVLLALPLTPLCSSDCSGPAPERFPAGKLADIGSIGEAPVGDPRWAALDALRELPQDSGNG